MSAASERIASLLVACTVVIAPVPVLAAPSSAEKTAAPPPSEPSTSTSSSSGSSSGTSPSEPGDASSEPTPTETPTTEEPTTEPAADDRAVAAASFLEGSKHYELGQYPLAIEKFERAWELSNEPLLLFNLGQAYWRWFDVDPQAEHLRRAKQSFQNYDKRMRGSPGYDPTEVHRFIERIDEQLVKAEETADARVERELKAREESERRRMWLERERQIVTGLNASGITLITIGSLTLAMGLGGMITRVANKVVLDQSSGGERQVNLSSAAEDAQRRRGFIIGGQLAFSGFIIGGVLLPVGIALKVLGGVRERRALGRKDEKKKADVAVSGDGITVRF